MASLPEGSSVANCNRTQPSKPGSDHRQRPIYQRCTPTTDMNEQYKCMVMQIKLLDFCCCCCCCFFSMIQPRSCITPGDNTSSQSLLRSCCVVAHPVGECDGNLLKSGILQDGNGCDWCYLLHKFGPAFDPKFQYFLLSIRSVCF